MSLTPASSLRAVPLIAAVLGLALLAAGCGASAQSSSSSTAPTFRSFATAAYQYADCMRKHSLANFPDPHVVDQPGRKLVMQALPPGLESSPRFAAAKAACRGILPSPGGNISTPSPAQEQAREQDLLAFVRCLRSHGLPNFPDPSQGQLTRQSVAAAGVDLHAPAVLPAAKACIRTANGAITGADVVRAVNGAQ